MASVAPDNKTATQKSLDSLVAEHAESSRKWWSAPFVTTEHSAWRKKLAHLLECWKFEVIIITLLIIDVFCVLTEFLHDEEVLNPHKHWLKEFAHVCGIISRVITGIFCVEVIAHMVAFGRAWFKHCWYVLDFVVVYTTAILEFIVIPIIGEKEEKHGHAEEGAEKSAEAVIVLIMVLRFWRVVRLAHGLAFAEHMRHHKHEEDLEALKKKVEEEEEIIHHLKEENEDLHRQVDDLLDLQHSREPSAEVDLEVGTKQPQRLEAASNVSL